jgi:D-arabinose 1-dehydrogenase-like Zn-dependent alcohol dehydrogenase
MSATKVYAYTWDNPKGGFYAEYVATPSDNVAHIPKPLDLKHAGAIPVTGLTALQGIDDVLHLKKDQTVIIHGASAGVGTLAIQFAKLRGPVMRYNRELMMAILQAADLTRSSCVVRTALSRTPAAVIRPEMADCGLAQNADDFASARRLSGLPSCGSARIVGAS